jgi:hypothetical protein
MTVTYAALILYVLGNGNGTGAAIHEVSRLYRLEVCEEVAKKLEEDSRAIAVCVPLDKFYYWGDK